MERTPQSLRSSDSVSPYHHSEKRAGTQSFDPPQPTSPGCAPREAAQGTGRGLGLYGYSMPSATSPLAANVLPPSPQPSEIWSRHSLPQQSIVYCNQEPPDVFSAAYDPFASSSAAGLMRCAFNTPAQDIAEYRNSNTLPSQRSSISSGPTSDVYSQAGSDLSYNAPPGSSKIKVEDPNDWFPVSNPDSTLPAAFPSQSLVTIPQDPFPTSTDGQSAYEQRHDWAREPIQRLYRDYSRSFEASEYARYDDEFLLSTSIARTRKRRQLTTPAEANHECRICGKLFGRSYNYKAHLETHDPARVYPHPCTVKNCTKKFVRKTDLLRHQDSVHFKSRNFGCNLCGGQFARKDTLRRHVEDGCPKRYEIISRKDLRTPNSAARIRLPTYSSHSAVGPVQMQSSSSLPPLSQSMQNLGAFGRADYNDHQTSYLPY